MTPLRSRLTAARAFAGAALLLGGVSAPARADDVTGYVELLTAEAQSTQSLLALPTTETDSSLVNRRLYLNFGRQAWPWVRFWGGGTFDDADIATDFPGGDSDTDERRLRPYLGVGRQTSQWLTQLSWSRDQRETEVAGQPERTSIRDGFFGTLAFTPQAEDVPRARLALARTEDHDRARELRDQVSDLADLAVAQQINPSLRWTYRGTLTSRDDRLRDTEATTTAHRADIGYTDQWLDRRVLFHAEYAVNYAKTVVQSRAGADVDVPIFPLDGLVNRDDTPLDGALASTPGLVDDDTVVPTIVDLGLPPLGGDTRPWGIGLDLGLIQTVNVAFVWLDRDLRPDIAATLVWQVYTSPDNTDWTPRASVSPAPYDEFLRRFEVPFADLSTRFVKLVVRPLDPAVPDASNYPDLFVTEIDAVTRVVAPTGRTEANDTRQTLNVDARARLLANHDLYYFGNLNLIDPQGADADYRLSNGLSYLLPFAPEASLTSRVVWEESREAGDRERAFVYSAALDLRPVERLSYSLSLSGREEQAGDELGGDQVSLLFYGVATLIEGVDLRLGAGRSYLEDPFGGVVPSTQVDFGARIEPRRDLLLQLSYIDSSAEARVAEAFVEDIFTRASEANVTYTPVPTVYLFGAYRLEWRSDLARDTIRRSSASWTPFPQAAFRLSLSYDDTRRELNHEHQRSYGTALRYNFNPRSYLELSWFNSLDEQDLASFENQVLSAILHWGF